MNDRNHVGLCVCVCVYMSVKTHRVSALELTPEQTPVGSMYAEVLVQQGREVLVRGILFHREGVL